MKTLYAAEACGRLVALAQRGGQGQVHSVFRTAVNLRVEGTLLCLLSAQRSPHPHSAVLAEAVDFEATGLIPGAPVTLEGAAHGGYAVIIGGAAPLAVSLKGATPLDLSIKSLGKLSAPRARDEKPDTLAEAILQSPGAAEGLAPMLAELVPGKFPPLPLNHWCDFLLPRVRALPATLQSGDAVAIREAGRRLAGCGPGLTPSSDDFLVGLAAALWGAQAAALWPQAGRAAQSLTAGAAKATGTIPAAYLQNAAEGFFSRDILHLLAAYFSAAPPESLRAAAAAVAGFGSSSGTDILAGLWFGLSFATCLPNK